MGDSKITKFENKFISTPIPIALTRPMYFQLVGYSFSLCVQKYEIKNKSRQSPMKWWLSRICGAGPAAAYCI